MKKKFKCNAEQLYDGICSLLISNAQEFGNVKITSVSDLDYHYDNTHVKVLENIKNEQIRYQTSMQSDEIFEVTFKITKKNSYAYLDYQISAKHEKKTYQANYLFLSNTLYYFSKKAKFKQLCTCLEMIINDKK